MHAVRYGPVCRVRDPGYPTRLAVAAAPELLHRLPPPWRRRRELAWAAGFALGTGSLTLSTGCLFPMGCVAVTPPSKFPEEEALVVIKDELAKQGVCLTAEKVPLPGVTLRDRTGRVAPVVVDLANDARTIALEYVSAADCERNGERWIEPAAARMVETVRKEAPTVKFKTLYLSGNEMTPARARRLLRQQVKSFVDWLKAQGAI